MAYAVGVAVVSGIVIFLLEGIHKGLHLLYALHRVGKGDEAASVILEKPLCRCGYALIAVRIICHTASYFTGVSLYVTTS